MNPNSSGAGPLGTPYIEKTEWKRPFRNTNQRFFCVVRFRNLCADTHYQVEFDRRIEAKGGIIRREWQHLRSGQLETLPNELLAEGQRPFTFAIENWGAGKRGLTGFALRFILTPELVVP